MTPEVQHFSECVIFFIGGAFGGVVLGIVLAERFPRLGKWLCGDES